MKLKQLLMLPIEGALSLFYPNICNACLDQEAAHGEIMCISCQADAQISELHLHKENDFTRHFWGRIPIHAGAAMYRFSKNGLSQQLITEFKYKGKIEVGEYLGKLYGTQLKASPLFHDVDLIIPVPLHYKKKGKRGFNQSEVFGRALAGSMNCSFQNDLLQRRVNTPSQTRLSRMQRVQNLQQAFLLNKSSNVNGLHVLLVDDVLTTGATLEACAAALLAAFDIKISMVTIGMGSSI